MFIPHASIRLLVVLCHIPLYSHYISILAGLYPHYPPVIKRKMHEVNGDVQFP